MLVMRPRSDPTRPSGGAGLHPFLAPRVVLLLPAGRAFSLHECLEFVLRARAPLVLRRERPGGLTRDPVLERHGCSDAKWIGHWLIRLDALRGRVGHTRALILDGGISQGLGAVVARLKHQGAQLRTCPSTIVRGGERP
jgi:hypothetical protein